MESKEAALDQTAEVSPGLHATFSSPINNDVLVSNTIGLNFNYEDNNRNDSKVVASEDEGYVSGNEVFEAATDKPVSDEVEGEGAQEGSAEVSVKAEIRDKAVEGDVDGNVVGKGFTVDAEGDFSDSVEKLGISSGEGVGEVVDGQGEKEVVEEVEVGGKELTKVEMKVSDPEVEEVPEATVEQEKLEVSYSGNAKSMPEEDSVVESIQVDVAIASPGVAVVGETKDNKDTVNKPDEDVVVGVDAVKSAESELVSVDDVSLTKEGEALVGNSQVDVSGSGASVGKTKEEFAEVKLTSEGDSIIDNIQVDVVDSGVAVVGEVEENGGVLIEEEEVPRESVDVATENGKGIGEDISSGEVGLDLSNSYSVSEDAVAVADSELFESERPSVGCDKDECSDAGAVVHLENEVRGGNLENGTRDEVHEHKKGLVDGISKESTQLESDEPKAVPDLQEIREVEDGMDEAHPGDSMSDGDNDDMVFRSSEAAKRFIEELEQESGGDSRTGVDSPFEQSQRIDGQIATDSEEGETDEEGDGKKLFDSAALAALLKAATGADPSGGNITFTSQDGSRLFSLERPASLGSSLQSLRPASRPNRPNLFGSSAPAGGGESEVNLSEEEKKKLEKLQQIRVKFLRLVHRLGLSPEESVVAQVLYRLALLGGRQGTQTFSLDAAKRTALQLEASEKDDIDFSINILTLGKSGVGKSATVNSLLGENKAPIDAFETVTTSAREISGFVDGVKVRIVDTPGLKSSVMDQGINCSILSSVKKFNKKNPPDVVLYVDRLDAQSRDLNDLPLLKTVTSTLGNPIWRSAIVTLTHAASAPPDGPSGTLLSYEVFVSQRSHIVQQSIGHAVGDLRMMSPSLMNPVSLVENHPSCRTNREGQKILPNGQSWRPQLLLLCYSMKILSEASSISKPQDPFDHRKLFGFRARAPPLPYMLSSMLQCRPHPKLPSDQGGDSVDSDVDLDDFSDSDGEEDEYDQLPPFKPLRKAQIAKLTRDQKKAYFEEYDYRVKLLQKKQWKEEMKRMREIKNRGKEAVVTDYEEEGEPGGAAPVAVPLPDMALPPSFDGDNPAFRYRFLEPTSQFLARPVLDSHGWDHDCGYDGVNLEHSLAIFHRLAAAYTIQITKDKKDFTISVDSSVSAKHGDNISTMAGFDVQSIGKQLAYIIRAETKLKNLKKHKAGGGLSFTFLGENIVPGVKVEDQITFGKQYALVGSAGAVRSQKDTAYGANIELQRRELDYPIGQVQSTLSVSIIKWRGDLALGFNSLAQFSLGRNSKVAVRGGINNKLSGQITVRTSSSEHLSLALAAVIPAALSIYKKLYSGAGEKYSIY